MSTFFHAKMYDIPVRLTNGAVYQRSSALHDGVTIYDTLIFVRGRYPVLAQRVSHVYWLPDSQYKLDILAKLKGGTEI